MPVREAGVMRVRDVMSGNVVTIGSQVSCREAVMRMHQFRVRHLPAVDAGGRLVRVVSFLNFMEHWADTYRTRGPEPILAAWRARDALTGRLVEVREKERTYRAEVRGATERGG